MLFDKVLKNLLNVFFPDVCLGCSSILLNNEHHICIKCRSELPLTNYHFSESQTNEIHNSFYGRFSLTYATSLFFFSKKGIVQQFIHNLKYRNQEHLGSLFGNWLGEELAQSNHFKNIDFIIGVPIHKKRKKQRGYNQVTKFGQSIANHFSLPYIEHALIRKQNTKTQTKKNRKNRFESLQNTFQLNEQYKSLENKHVLLVDDVITTGATIEACALELKKHFNVTISIATIAYTI